MHCWENEGAVYTLTRPSDYDDDEPKTGASTPVKSILYDYLKYKRPLKDYFARVHVKTASIKYRLQPIIF